MEQIRAAVIDAKSAHQVHTPEITLVNDEEATIIWAMQDRVVWNEGKSPIAGVKSITGFGHYHERYVRRDGEWRIASLKLTRLHVDMHQLSWNGRPIPGRSEEHTSELQSLMRISYAVFCLKKQMSTTIKII